MKNTFKDLVHKRNVWILMIAFVIYTIITFIGAINHELWFDEAQAWAIAKNTDFSTLFGVLKHEGHPALWYLILYPFAKVGFYCEVMNIISWSISVITIALFLCKAPFGNLIKCSVMFSSGFLFFNSVNSRVYCLIPLFLFLIAIVYPKRKEHPIAFGLLIGLLANTHLMMSGFVGILGIYMLIDLFKNIKANGFYKCIGQVIGLIIAGVGVLLLILPLIGSMSSNNMIQSQSTSFCQSFLSACSTFYNIGNCLMIDYNLNFLISIIASVIGMLVLLLHALMFRYRKAFVMSIVYTIFYVIILGAIWYSNPSRASCYIYTLVVIYWIAIQTEKPRDFSINIPENIGKLTKKILGILKNIFSNCRKSILAIFCIILFASAPTGVFWLFYDYGHEFSCTEKTGKFISECLPKDSVIVVDLQVNVAQFNVYAPDTRFYSLELQEFLTYNPHMIADEDADYIKIYNDLKDEPHLYYLISADLYNDEKIWGEHTVFSQSTYTHSTVVNGFVEISDTSLNKLIPADILADLQK